MEVSCSGGGGDQRVPLWLPYKLQWKTLHDNATDLERTTVHVKLSKEAR